MIHVYQIVVLNIQMLLLKKMRIKRIHFALGDNRNNLFIAYSSTNVRKCNTNRQLAFIEIIFLWRLKNDCNFLTCKISLFHPIEYK